MLDAGARGALYASDALGPRTYDASIDWDFDSTHLSGVAAARRKRYRDAAALNELDVLYRILIEAENHHALAEVRNIVWKSLSTLFVAKTATPEEGNWAGFWGTDTVMQHFADIFGDLRDGI